LGEHANTTTLAALTHASRGDDVLVEQAPAVLGDRAVKLTSDTAESEATLTVARATALVAQGSGMKEGDLYIAEPTVRSAAKTANSGEDVIRSFATMRDLGVQRVFADAHRGDGEEKWNGYETWARMGAHGDIPKGRVLRAAQKEFPGVTRVEALMGTAKGRSWWRANGDSFNATMDLSPGGATREYVDRMERHLNERQGS
jgi:hypothetical protein